MKTPESMHYVETTGPGNPEVMYINTGPIPSPKADEVLIRVMAAGINRPDISQRKGLYPPPTNASPIMGLEVAGEVVAKGNEVTNINLRDSLCALTNGGGYAEYCAVPAVQCLPWPKHYTAVQAAALPETFFTVWANLFQIGHFAHGESLLIHGGTSGIGVTALQLAKAWGGQVYVTAGSKEKCEACLNLGATAAINYREENFADRILELTKNQGVNVVLDIVGAPYFADNLRCLTTGGRLIQVSTMQGGTVDKFDLKQVMTKHLTIAGSTMRPRSTQNKGRIAKELQEKVWPLLNSGQCSPLVFQVFPFSKVVDAHHLMESSQHIGKIILEISGK